MSDKGHNSGSTGGRPRKAEAERRDATLPPVRVTAAELAHVLQLAEAAGLSLSDFVRHRALNWRMPRRTSETDDRTIYELNRVGVNLAQIVKRLNMTGDVALDAAEVLAEVKAAVERVARDGS